MGKRLFFTLVKSCLRDLNILTDQSIVVKFTVAPEYNGSICTQSYHCLKSKFLNILKLDRFGCLSPAAQLVWVLFPLVPYKCFQRLQIFTEDNITTSIYNQMHHPYKAQDFLSPARTSRIRTYRQQRQTREPSEHSKIADMNMVME